VTAGDVTESQGWTEGNASPRIVAAHNTRDVIPDRIQPLDWGSVTVEHPGVSIGDQAGIGSEITDDELDRVIRGSLKRCDARVRCVQRIPLVAVVRCRALSEGRILSVPGVDIELSNGCLETGWINAGLVSEFAHGRPPEQVA